MNTGKPYWTHDLLAAVWGSPFVVDGKVYLGDEDGDVVVMQHGKEKKVLAEMNMGSAVYVDHRPGQRRDHPEQPQPALLARGEVARSRTTRTQRHRGQRQGAALCLVPLWCRLGGIGVPAGRRRLAAVPRQSAPDRRRHRSAARLAQGALELRAGRHVRLVAGDRQRRGLRRARPTERWPPWISPPASCAGSTPRAARSASENHRRRWRAAPSTSAISTASSTP